VKPCRKPAGKFELYQYLLPMSVVNRGEVYYSVWRTGGERVARRKLREIAQLPIEIVDADFEFTRLAPSLKALHGLPYAGCFAAALAQSRKAPLVTSDRDFDPIESLVKIVWL
jgi:predicted nucleic acid-binding protein